MRINRKSFLRLAAIGAAGAAVPMQSKPASAAGNRGGPDRPFTRDELRAKFTDCAQLTLEAARIPPVVAGIDTIETLTDIRQLARLMAVSSPG